MRVDTNGALELDLPTPSGELPGLSADVDDVPLLQVVSWSGDGTAAVGITPDGAVWTSTDAAASWTRRAQLDGAPQAVAATTADGDLRVLVATDHGLLESTDGGATFTTLLST